MAIHKSVLLRETIDGLNLEEGAVAVDATLGGGGHSLEILKKIGRTGKLVAIDQDERALENFKKRLKLEVGNSHPEYGKIFFAKDNFSNLKNILESLDIDLVDGVVADLGYSSDQMEDAARGMSFLKDARLDMRLDTAGRLTAEKVVNEYSQAELEKILKNYGEERFAKNIARKIIEKRKTAPIETTLELVEIIGGALPERQKHQRIHFATRTFQALRIEVNRELENLKEFIPQAIEALSPGGRLAVISFHSLEDRIVKTLFRENARGCICPKEFPECRCGEVPKIKIITKKPIVSGAEETKENPRARSAKLRICEKTKQT